MGTILTTARKGPDDAYQSIDLNALVDGQAAEAPAGLGHIRTGASYRADDEEWVNSPTHRRWWKDSRRWCQAALVLVIVGLLGALTFWLGPICVKKAVIPFLEWLDTSLTKAELAAVIFAGLALLPIILIPCSPFIWLAGIAFGYFWGYLLTVMGMALGMALTFFIGHKLIHGRVQRWLRDKPKYAAVLRACSQGDSWRQFRVSVLLRFSPVPPYPVLNYGVTATKMAFWPYFAGSVLGIGPEVFVALYSGNLLKDIADYNKGHHKPSVFQIAYNVVGVLAALGVVVGGAIYGRRAVREMELSQEHYGLDEDEDWDSAEIENLADVLEGGLGRSAGLGRSPHHSVPARAPTSPRGGWSPPRIERALEDTERLVLNGGLGRPADPGARDDSEANLLQAQRSLNLAEVGENRLQRLMTRIKSSKEGNGSGSESLLPSGREDMDDY